MGFRSATTVPTGTTVGAGCCAKAEAANPQIRTAAVIETRIAVSFLAKMATPDTGDGAVHRQLRPWPEWSAIRCDRRGYCGAPMQASFPREAEPYARQIPAVLSHSHSRTRPGDTPDQILRASCPGNRVRYRRDCNRRRRAWSSHRCAK